MFEQVQEHLRARSAVLLCSLEAGLPRLMLGWFLLALLASAAKVASTPLAGDSLSAPALFPFWLLLVAPMSGHFATLLRSTAETLLQDEVDGPLKHEGVVDGDQTDTLVTVPAGQATAGNGTVHKIIADQEEGLEQLGEPAQDTQVLELLLGQGLLQESETGVGYRETAVELATGGVREQRV